MLPPELWKCIACYMGLKTWARTAALNCKTLYNLKLLDVTLEGGVAGMSVNNIGHIAQHRRVLNRHLAIHLVRDHWKHGFSLLGGVLEAPCSGCIPSDVSKGHLCTYGT